MEKKQVAIENPVIISGLSITPLTESSIYCWEDKNNIFFFAHKKPLYIFISKPESPTEAFTLTGEAVSFDSITLKFPELKEALEKVQIGNPQKLR